MVRCCNRPSTEGAFLRRGPISLLLVASLFLWPSCQLEPAPVDVGPLPDNVATVLETVVFSTLQDAFAELEGRPYERTVTTRQLDPDQDRVVGRLRERWSYTAQEAPPTVQEIDREGAFDFGGLSPFASEDDASPSPRPLATDLVPDEPGYLNPRTREFYTFERAADSTVAGVPVRVVVIRARPEAANAQVAYVRLAVTPDGVLASYTLRRIADGVLYDEDRTLQAELQRTPAGVWTPQRLSVEVTMQLPLQPRRQFQTESVFSVPQ